MKTITIKYNNGSDAKDGVVICEHDPFKNRNEITNWIENELLTEKYLDLIPYYEKIDFGVRNAIVGFICHITVPEGIDIKECNP